MQISYTPEQIAAHSQAELDASIFVERGGERQYLFIPTPDQRLLMGATEKNVFACSNRGSGKSVTERWACHALAMAVPNFRYAFLRTSFPELLKNHLIYLQDELDVFGGKPAGYNYNSQDHVVYYPNGSTGFWGQCATDADVKKVLGAEVAKVVFDEAPTFQWDHMRLIAASVRTAKGSGLRGMTRYLGNPVGESIDEIWKYFVDKDVDRLQDPGYNPEDFRVIWMDMNRNPYLDLEDYKRQFTGLPPHIQAAWLRGERVEENTLFRLRPTVDGKPYHVLPEIPMLSDETPLIRWVD
jgi:hypothetical protein